MTPSTVRLKQLAEAATPGPWDDYREQGILPSLFSYEELSNGQRKLVEYIGHAQKEENRQFIAAANPEAVLGLIARIEELEKHLALALSFAPKGPVPEGLSPEFYHTLNYHSEVELQKRIDEAREALKEET